MWQTNLIRFYCAICDEYSTIDAVMQRQSNNFRPQFSDEECMTVYVWGIHQRRFEHKAIYEYTKNHLGDWFPNLPSYQAFSDRKNRLVPAFQALAEIWLAVLGADLCEHIKYIVDSCPIILAKGPRSGHAKVARELCEKSYNSSRKEWYYGLKLHAVVARNPGHLPLPLCLMADCAAKHDLPVLSVLSASPLSVSSTDSIASPMFSLLLWSAPFPVSFFMSLAGLPLLSLPSFSTLDSHV